ncbi:3'-5' exonuclease family protein [Spirosoma flavum]|uniref:Uncharacterized protein n=1 Tax=Spirosoma flavum TaxID=2048557 RepID=A0ABW6AH96_9BACT
MEKCFVIQPFDNDKFDKKFADIFEPAIIKAGFDAYRIDKDLSVRIPIDEIEKGISESAICFAEITADTKQEKTGFYQINSYFGFVG